MEPLDLRSKRPLSVPEPRDDTPPTAGGGWWGDLSVVQKVIAVVLGLVVLFAFYIALDANKYSATVLVVEGEGRVGINPTTEVLDFGDLSPGTPAVRRVEIANGTSIPIFVAVVRFGSITDLLELSRNFFVLPGETVERLEFSVYMPASAPVGERLNGRVYLFKI